MDTRTKIVPFDELLGHLGTGNWTVVVGLFDPLTAHQAQRIAGHRRNTHRLAAIVSSAPDTLLNAQARAALVASLRAVDLVAIADANAPKDLLPPSASIEVIDDPTAETSRTADFVRFVIERHKSANT